MRARAGGAGRLLPLLLLLPPAGNILWELERGRAARAREAEPAAGETEASIQIAALRQLLWTRERELEVLRGWSQTHPRHTALPAEVVHVGDLSQRRDALWIHNDGLPGVTARTPVVHRGALVGRVERILGERRLARVQTLRDPYFRVRFRYREASGFLWGTGRADRQGRPLLEVRLLNMETRLQEGEPIFTEGGDGFYPPGLPVGLLVRGDGGREGAFQVRAHHDPRAISEVVLLVDQAALEASNILSRGEAE